MNATELILIIFLAYQISAMPLPAWIATGFFGVDSDLVVNGSQWVENRYAKINIKWSLLVFSIEFLKGFLAMSMLHYLNNDAAIGIVGVQVPMVAIMAFVIILGHTFPIYASFNRSRSVGAYFGVFAGLWLLPTLYSLLVFGLIWFIFKKVSIKSLILSLGSLVIITFMLFDLKALIMAVILSSTLLISNLPPQYKEVTI